MVEQFCHLLTEETGYDGRRSLVGTESVSIGGRHDGRLQQSVVTPYTHECLHDEDHEAEIVLNRLARSMEEHPCVGGKAPVVMLARTIDAGKRLFVEQYTETMLASHFLHKTHEEHIVVHSEVGVLENWRQLKLVWSHLVVTGLARDAEFQSLNLKVLHKCLHSVGNRAEIVVVHLLVLGRVVTHEGASCEEQVGTSRIETFIHKEIFLFPTQVGSHLLHVRVEITAHLRSCHIHGMEGTQERSLIVECLTAITDKDGWNTKCVVDDEHWTRWVPCRIATCLEGATNTARWERTGIRFLLNEQLAREFLHHTTFSIVLDEGVVLLGSPFSERLEPVGVVGDAIFGSPLLHTCCHSICYVAVEACTIVNYVNHLLIHILWQVLVHLFAVEHFLSKILTRSSFWSLHVERLLTECLLNNLKS